MNDLENRAVLVASADPDVREILARVIETAGLEAVRLEADADVANAVVTTRCAGLVLDLGADNLAALRVVRDRPEAAARASRIVVIGTGPATGRLAWHAGADGYLMRPFHNRDLQRAFTETLELDDAGRAARREAEAEALVS